MTLISLKSIYKIYNVGGEEVRALDGIDLDINENEYLAIMGPSGSGKSTFINTSSRSPSNVFISLKSIECFLKISIISLIFVLFLS